jgi:hypothetical protein
MPEAEARVVEMENGILVSKPLKKVEEITESKPRSSEPMAHVWKLTPQGPVLESKAASVAGINKLREICDFIRSNGRVC